MGADLTPAITSRRPKPVLEPDGGERTGVLFATDDMITEPLPYIADPHSESNETNFQVFCEALDWYRSQPHPAHPDWEKYTSRLKPGPACQPCHVRCRLRQSPAKMEARMLGPGGYPRNE